jgi:hypothetical protein
MLCPPDARAARRVRSRIVSEAAKLLAPQPAPAPGEALNLTNLPVDLLVRAVP